MNLKHLTDKCLLDETKKLVCEERQLVTAILHHLAEVQRRRLFCRVGCSSLFTYCTEILRYSEYQAHQKISAMRLILEVPELEKKIEEGDISLTNVAQAQSFFKQEAKATKTVIPIEQKKKVLKKLESISTRQGQRILLSLSSQPVTVVEREMPVTPEITEIRFAANDELLGKLKKLKGLMAHKKTNMTYSELINELCELSLDKLDPLRKAKRAKQTQDRKADRADQIRVCKADRARASQFGNNTCSVGLEKSDDNVVTDQITLCAQSGSATTKSERRQTRFFVESASSTRMVPVSVRHQAWVRAKGICENCGSQHALQLDHRKPYALGGKSVLENIRVLCRSCNQRAAIESFGAGKLEEYLRPQQRT